MIYFFSQYNIVGNGAVQAARNNHSPMIHTKSVSQPAVSVSVKLKVQTCDVLQQGRSCSAAATASIWDL